MESPQEPAGEPLATPPNGPGGIAAGLRERLTLSDLAGFAQEGGMIELFPDEGKLRFAVNLVAVKRADLEINARLLGLARGVIRE